MNFINNRKDIQRLLWKGLRKSEKTGKMKKTFHRGLYIFSRDQFDTRVKIGQALGEGGLYNRLNNQYRICYAFPDEFYVHFFMISATIDDTKLLEKLMLKKVRTIPNQGSSREWKVTSSRQVLKEKIVQLLNQQPNLWTHFVVFGEAGWKLHRNFGEMLTVGAADRPPTRRSTKESIGLLIKRPTPILDRLKKKIATEGAKT